MRFNSCTFLPILAPTKTFGFQNVLPTTRKKDPAEQIYGKLCLYEENAYHTSFKWANWWCEWHGFPFPVGPAGDNIGIKG